MTNNMNNKYKIMTKTYEQYTNILNGEVDINEDVIREIVSNNFKNLDTKWVVIEDIVKGVYKSLPNKMILNELYYYISDFCATKIGHHPDFNKLAAHICIERLYKGTPETIKDVCEILYNNIDVHGEHNQLISDEYYNIVMDNYERIQKEMDMNRDYSFDFFGIRTLERSYLFRIHNQKQKAYHKDDKKGQIIERPQHMIMRVAIGIHGTDLEAAFETYHLISMKKFTHATPTLFNAGTKKPQFSSCYLLGVEDNIEGIMESIKNMAFISKWAGGIGAHLSAIRAKGSLIRGTNGMSDGIIPLCILLNKLGKYINQGGKRNGSISVYLEPWHADIMEFCELKKNTKDEDSKARDLFIALWVPDLFVKRVKEDGVWSLMCPDQCPNLNTTYGEEFEKLYTEYEKQGKYKRQIRAVDLWYHIMDSQIETGMPYLLYKDHVNRKSNQKNLGTIRSSNLCAEICQYSDKNEIAVCNLTSICLPAFIKVNESTGVKEYDYANLAKVAKVCVRNLNKIIDKNFYPTKETQYSNLKNRPIGIGIQGLADVYNIFDYAFGSDEARLMNKNIFETIYFASLEETCDLAKKYGKVESFAGSPFSQGELQWHMWGLKESDLTMGFDWATLINNIKTYGTRNSLLTALMPTASTSQIMGNYEAFEPYQSNIFVRSTLAGEFIVLNDNLVKKLIELNLWSETMRKRILVNNGSVQLISEIPAHIREVYKTAFEMKQKDIIIQSAERGPFVDQSQSMNLFMEKINYDVLTSCHLTSWKLGLKTAMYYLRSRPAVDPLSFGVDAEELELLLNMNMKTNSKPSKCMNNTRENKDLGTVQRTVLLDNNNIKYGEKTKLSLSDIKFASGVPESIPVNKSRNIVVAECIGCSS